MASSDGYLLVAAIDFGTTYSGYAFSMRDTFKSNPLQIYANTAWNAGTKLLSMKTPTCLLLNSSKEFVAFGYEAENEYIDLVDDDKHEDYFYFHRFKMNLYKKPISSEMMIEDIRGRPMMAMEVFAHSIRYLTNHLLKTLKTQGTGVRSNEIRWVLTVPAIWNDKAKMFMRTCAIKAGISKESLLISLEPEAASVFCQYSPTVDSSQGLNAQENPFGAGSKYMVVDLGGGTADITVHEKIDNGRLKELCRASGSDCGGTSVDAEFIQLLAKIFGAPLLTSLKREQPGTYLDLLREFETAKRIIKTEKTGKVNMTIPYATINKLCQEQLGEEIPDCIASSPYRDLISTKGDKLRIDASLFKQLFKKTIDNVVEQTSNVLRDERARGVTQILLVGGFGECELVHDALKQRFPRQRVIVPGECGLAVLKGAVLFGHDPDIIGSRFTRFTYGIAVNTPFDPAVHKESYSEIINGEKKCTDLFAIIIAENVEVKAGTEVRKTYYSDCSENEICFRVFAAKNKTPVYIDEEGCTLLGKATITISDSSVEQPIDVVFIFGKTELTLTAVERLSQNRCELEVSLV